MTRRAWTAIAVAVVVNLTVVATALALDGRGRADTLTVASVAGERVARPDESTPAPTAAGDAPSTSSTSSSTTTTTRPDPLALPPAPTPAVGVLPTDSAGAPVVSRVPTTDRVVFVTIDDGLVQDPAVVDTVRRLRIPVTLFLVRDFARQGQAYFQQFVDVGGLVEAHTVNHPNLTTLSANGQYAEICGPLGVFEELFGRRPVLFRPPGGAYNATTQSIAASCGYRYVVNWTAAANDGRIDWQARAMQPGDIVLFHFRNDLVQNLQLLATLCRQQGFTVARLEDYLLL
jgi:peptidoglycan/xylan/chitin deacetylase (PgdA/CDA1 family)